MLWFEQVKALPGESYHIHGTIELLYGHRSEKIEREIDITLAGRDAGLLHDAENERVMATMIANVYFEQDIDESEPPFALAPLENWQLVVEPGQADYNAWLARQVEEYEA